MSTKFDFAKFLDASFTRLFISIQTISGIQCQCHISTVWIVCLVSVPKAVCNLKMWRKCERQRAGEVISTNQRNTLNWLDPLYSHFLFICSAALACFSTTRHGFSRAHTRTHPPFWCYLQCIRNSAYIEQQHQTHARFHVSNQTKMHGIALIYYLTNFLAFMTRCDSMLVLKFVMASVRAFALHQMWPYKWSYYNRQRWFWFMYIFFIKMAKMCIHNSNCIYKKWHSAIFFFSLFCH